MATLEKQTKADFEEYTKPIIDLNDHNLQNSIKSWCTYCMRDRVITTNGKCRVCGAVLVSQKHWKPTIAKIKIIMNHRKDTIPIEINKRLYFVPKVFFQTFKENEHLGYKAHVMLVEYIRKECESYSIERS
ncbi:MAG: hypothetical protein GTO44_10020 [Hydrotalea flava]|nr:hypothetical protein [Hydrotalea flava]NIN15389.1 hypothetical protein [Hydrotalea flava]